LEHGVTHAHELGIGRTDDGGLAQKAQGFGDHPFGPRQPRRIQPVVATPDFATEFK
jgi:hypothetical protein